MDTARSAIRTLRRHAGQVGWRSAVDSIRDIWRAWPAAERRRFLRHAAPWWDVHRHRMAPGVATWLEEPIWGERLAIEAARLEQLTCAPKGFFATLRRRGRDEPVQQRFDAVVNCTGPTGDLADFPVLARLAAAGLARPDRLSLGLDTDAAGRLIGTDGHPAPGLFAIGPLTRGAQWETVAVPDLRRQAMTLALSLAAALV